MSDRRLAVWQAVTLATLFAGYAGYYVCRSNLSVCSEAIIAEYKDQGFDKDTTGAISSAAVFCYAIGKITNGPAADLLGGRRVFLAGMIASAACTLAFGFATSLSAFFVAFCLNRFIQSAGWGSMLQIVMRWFPRRILATATGLLSLSYLLGDAAARLYLGLFLKAGFGWRGVFFVAASTLAGIACMTFLFLHGSPRDLGMPEQQPDLTSTPANDRSERPRLAELLATLFANPLFWIVCTMSVGLTFIRELFNFWSPTYLKKVGGLADHDAAMVSGLFPLVGAGVALLAGWQSDRLRGRHGRIVVPALIGLVTMLVLLATLPMSDRPMLATLIIGGAFFFLMAPYTFLSGVMSMELGGKAGSSTAAGIVDGVGYLAAVLSGYGVGAIVKKAGAIYGEATAWAVVMGVMAVAAALTLVAGIAYLFTQERILRVVPVAEAEHV